MNCAPVLARELEIIIGNIRGLGKGWRKPINHLFDTCQIQLRRYSRGQK